MKPVQCPSPAHPPPAVPPPISSPPHDRLEHLLQRQRQFAADASHQLRTSVTALRIRLEEALRYPDEIDPHQAIDHALHCVERLEKTICEVLYLAESSTLQSVRHEPVDLSDLVAAEVSRHPSTRLTADVQEQITVVGDRTLLGHMLTHVLDSAERHCHSTITVSLTDHQGHAVLTISGHRSQGDGFGDHRALPGFARLDSTGDHATQDRYLGLTLARDVAFVHNGTFRTEAREGRVRYICRIPQPAGG